MPRLQEKKATRLIMNERLYEEFIIREIPETRRYLWIATADVKNMHIKQGRRYVPFLALLAELLERGVEIRMLHAKEPGPNFRKDFDKYPALVNSPNFERVLCPRVHMKALIIDGRQAYIGSANLTGAGMGVRAVDRRNFEAGVLSRDPEMVNGIMENFDAIFRGDHCGKCKLKKVCPDPIL